ncbi:carboxypeptidase-like regulatory domain-containing protein [Aquimarina sp. TRL1]|uniref:carboxypeptidase-like regulatory domain-containing protein n=1 Tax=Aquimarina sp. (strain TRL1) TaxID=2736252 RepID=UPI00158AA04E|nr:carboxypeptidase-like regulatory domain-containing protein [Aquimarina sp. TRL1]QKX07374.1 carboxypeptidase-like regulatory domain-containing protein [Aquimarina sp. TRL1]
MKNYNNPSVSFTSYPLLYFLITCLFFPYSKSSAFQETVNYDSYKGYIIDHSSKKPISSVTISLLDTNISTISNQEGEFLLKVPKKIAENTVLISHLGFKDKNILLSSLNQKKNTIYLIPSITELSQVNLTPSTPEEIIRAVIKKKGVNYFGDHTIMTAFYRESIKKRRTYVSLSEAVVEIYKNPYTSTKPDMIKLHRARKSADYKKLDTLAIKLQGGPSTSLYIDLIKNTDFLLTSDITNYYRFSFDETTKINDRDIYVLNFEQHPYIKDLLYRGKLYVDAKTMALTKATLSLNLSDKEKASKMFVKKKPGSAKVYPTEVSYDIYYREKAGKWYYGYGKIDLAFKINWKKRLFNSHYKLNVELAITDWKKNQEDLFLKASERLKSSVVISDEASGFSDPQFWGDYNVIEPERPIESVIKKIKKQLRKLN